MIFPFTSAGKSRSACCAMPTAPPVSASASTGTGAHLCVHPSCRSIPGLDPMINPGRERKRCAGISRFSTVTEHEPVPVRPLTNQSSLRSTMEAGTAKSPSSTTAPLSSCTTAPSKSQSATSLPDANGQKPVSVKLPSAPAGRLAARPDHRGDDGVRIAAVDVVLGLAGEVRQQPRVRVDDSGDPGGRAATLGEGRDRVEVGAHPEAVAAVAPGLDRLERAGRLARVGCSRWARAGRPRSARPGCSARG